MALKFGGTTPTAQQKADVVTELGLDVKLQLGQAQSAATANGLLFFNSSKVVTTGSALTFDGTSLGVNGLGNFGTLNVQRFVSTPLTTITLGDGATPANAVGIYFRQTSGAAGFSTVGASFAWYTGGAGVSEQMRLTSTGLGIGTSSPAYKLDVNGDIRVGVNTAFQLLIGQSSATRGSNIASSGGTSGNYNGLFLNSNGYGSGDNGAQFNTAQPSWRVAVGSGALEWAGSDAFAVGRVAAGGTFTSPSVLMKITSAGNVGIGTSSPPLRLSLLSNVDTDNTSTPLVMLGSNRVDRYASINSVRGSASTLLGLAFSTSNNAAPAEVMRLDPAGNVGIGTPSPGTRLEVVQSALNANAVTLPMAASAVAENYTAIRGKYSGGSDFCQSQVRFGVENTGTGTGFLAFATGTNSTTERMRINSAGNLGIGTTSPVARISAVAASDNTTVAVFGGPSGGTSRGLRIATGIIPGVSSNNEIAILDAQSNQGAPTMDFQTGGVTRARIDASGKLLVGTTVTNFGSMITAFSASSYTFESQRSTTGNEGHIAFVNANGAVGTIFTNGTLTTYNTSSDYRLKNITGPITTSGAYIDSLNPVEGTWKADGSTFVGLIAHEAQEASRTPVATGVKDGEQMQGMDYSSAEIIANLIAEVKSLRARLAAANI
jgi:hypothetical protein